MDEFEKGGARDVESDAQIVCDAVAAMVSGLGCPREVAVAVSVTAGSRLIELAEEIR